MSGTPFVGRDDELEILTRVWGRAVDASRPHLVTILGPAGIGKTRLGRELSQHVETSGGVALWGRSLPVRGTLAVPSRRPDHPKGRRHLRERRRRGRARQAREPPSPSLFPEPEADEATRYLSVVLGLGLDEPPDEVVHLQFAARMFVEHLAARDPILVVFEDVHWADAPLLDLIDYLVSHVRDARVVFLALARLELLESRRSWGSGMVGQTTLPLEPLTSDQAVTVATALLPEVGATAIDRVVAAGEGNPLFLEELAASVTDEVGPEELPTTVLAAIAARIDALPPSPRAVLLHASVIGHTFWREVLTAVMPSDGVVDALEALEDRGLIVRHPQSTVAGDVEYGFKHVLIRDGAYGTMPRAARRELHGAIARYLEDRLTDRPDLGWLLAHHWTQAGDPARAITYLLAAAQRAQDALAVDEAYDLLTRAFDLAEDEAERRRILLRRGDMLAKVGEFARADKELTALFPDLAGREEVEGLLALGMATHWTEQTDRTEEVSQRALTLSREQASTIWCRSGYRCSPRRTRCAASAATWRARSNSARRRWRCGRRDSTRSGSRTTSTSTAIRCIGAAGTARRTSWRCRRSRSAGSRRTARSSCCAAPA